MSWLLAAECSYIPAARDKLHLYIGWDGRGRKIGEKGGRGERRERRGGRGKKERGEEDGREREIGGWTIGCSIDREAE